MERELSDFLAAALPLAQAEAGTVVWFAIRIDDRTYAIFDAFESEEAREAHLNGPIAAALIDKAGELLAEPPQIKPVDLLAAKLTPA